MVEFGIGAEVDRRRSVRERLDDDQRHEHPDARAIDDGDGDHPGPRRDGPPNRGGRNPYDEEYGRPRQRDAKVDQEASEHGPGAAVEGFRAQGDRRDALPQAGEGRSIEDGDENAREDPVGDRRRQPRADEARERGWPYERRGVREGIDGHGSLEVKVHAR